MLVDTHCHIHEAEYPLDVGDVLARAREHGVNEIVCVGTSVQSSREAVSFAAQHEHVYASIGVHPHDTKEGYDIADLYDESVIAFGEIGLDYFYTHSPREIQITALESQLQLAREYNKPVIFHVREAFDDFWPILDNFSGIRGVLHSFTDNINNLELGLSRGLYVGVNGISTFTKDSAQRAMFAAIPLERMVLETDAPFLTPTPYRGKVNEPAFVRLVAEYHANQRSISLEELAAQTTANARELFAF